MDASRALTPGSLAAGGPRVGQWRGLGPGGVGVVKRTLEGIYPHRMKTQVRRPSPGVRNRATRLPGVWLTLSSCCVAERKTWMEGGEDCQHAVTGLALLPTTPILGARGPPSVSQGPCSGTGEGLRVEPWGKAQPRLTSTVSASPTALFPLTVATFCSSLRPLSSLPIMRSHCADSASHLGLGRGRRAGGLCLCPTRAWPVGASLSLCLLLTKG